MARSPEVFVVAGPNGAGKSTVVRAILPKRFPSSRFINADEIARALAIDSPIEAGRIMLERIHRFRDQRQTFAFETTLAAKTLVRFLREAQALGFRVHLAFVSVSSVALAKKRVAIRVKRGGHDIPAVDIERRFWRGLKNFFELYLPLADRWVLCDNSRKGLVVIARGQKGHEPVIEDRKHYERIRNATRRR